MSSIEIRYEKLVDSFQTLFNNNIKKCIGEQLQQKEKIDDNELKIIYTSCLIELYEQAVIINNYLVPNKYIDESKYIESGFNRLIHDLDKLFILHDGFCRKCVIINEFTLMSIYLSKGFKDEVWIDFKFLYSLIKTNKYYTSSV